MIWWHAHWEALVAFAIGLVWLSRLLAASRGMPKLAEISRPEWDLRPDPAPRVSIVVCALNEEGKIEPALRSLLELDYPDYEVVAVDDRSTDRTGEIMDRIAEEYRANAHHHLRVVHVTELPPGWLGKVHAMWSATRVADGDWILFTDADVVFQKETLRRAIAYAERERADHVVLFPTMLMYTWDERMMIAFFQAMFVFGHRPWKTADPKSRDHMGVGAFNLIRRSVYEKIGTYARMKMAVVDDMKLGEIVKKEGYAQRNVFGRDLIQLHWHSGALGVVRGLTKNFFAILRFNPFLTLGVILGMLLFNLTPFVGVFLTHGWARAGYALALASIAGIYYGMSDRSTIPWYYVVLHPVSTVLFAYTVGRSMVVTLAQDGITWRGTHYSLNELRKGVDV
ncbi:glycosyl transferase, family 2 [Candidatus Koribacter versatilis Ellin345]|uniref:Glycosyl transferase, family 2 n=1 Tax=Koribacter versatilis (strain Ellin345) TaxID=204669 RepID=Q1IQL4_KORVE|nr:glycosyltransferase family 2 protein [Candidatus Koribacter versatilis]ABF40836.1 glycosyl transferase, family 2 [Candidatus Koribacter versatilis Ellin345]